MFVVVFLGLEILKNDYFKQLFYFKLISLIPALLLRLAVLGFTEEIYYAWYNSG